MTQLALQHAAGSAFAHLINKTRPAAAAARATTCPVPADVATVAHQVISADNNADVSMCTEQMITHMSVTREQVSLLENATVLQRASALWKAQRLGRITASNFGRVFKWVNNTGKLMNADPTKVTMAICTPSTMQTVSMKHGVACERFAKEQYIINQCKSHKKFIATDCGLILHKDAPYLGASPDLRISCECHEPGICEIKCPYTVRDAVPTHENVDCLMKNENVSRLNCNHNYYFQIQGQMAITDTKYCDFFIYTTRGYYLERVLFDRELWQKMFSDLSLFWRSNVAPFMLTQAKEMGNKAASTAVTDHSYVPTTVSFTTKYIQPSSASTKRQSTTTGTRKHKFLAKTVGHTNVKLCGVCTEEVQDSLLACVECKQCHVWYHCGCAATHTCTQLDDHEAWHCDKCS